MKHLLLLSLGTLLSACERIELSVHQTPIQEQDVPYKQYETIGNSCQAADGGITTVLLRTASSQAAFSYNSGTPYVERSEVVVIKTNPQGQVEWTKIAWSGVRSSYFRPLIHSLNDGGYWVFLYSLHYTTTSSNTVPTLVHLNSVGGVLTTQTVVGVNLNVSFLAQSIFPLADKGFLISGLAYDGTKRVPSLMRFDKQGSLQWTHLYAQVTQTPNAYDLAATTDGGFILSWYGWNSAQKTDESYLLKLDAAGQAVWFRNYALFAARMVSQAADGGCVLQGIITSSLQSVYLYKLDKDGGIQWVRAYPLNAGTGQNLVTPLGIVTSADSYVLVYSASTSTINLITTNGAGDEQSRQSIDGPSMSMDNGDVLYLSDGSFVFSGKARSSYKTVVLTKTKPDKTFQWTSTIATGNR